MKRRSFLAVISGVLSLAACDSGTAASESEAAPAALEPPAVEVVAAESAMWTKVEQGDYFRWAEDVLLSECMAAAGFAFTARIEPREPVPEPPQFGLVDLAAATAFGLTGLAVDEQANAPANDPNWTYLQQQSPEDQAAYQAALYGPESDYFHLQVEGYGEVGVPGSGCLAKAQREIYGDLESWMAVYYWDLAVDIRAYELAVADPAYTEALAVWSACMAEAGFEVDDPGALRESVAAEVGDEQLSEAEIEAAVAEATCAAVSGHVGVGESLLADQQAAIQTAESDKQTEFTERSRVAVAAATEILRPHIPADLLQKIPFSD